MFYEIIQTKKKAGLKLHALLIDPENTTNEKIAQICTQATIAQTDIIFVGGSIMGSSITKTIEIIKKNTKIPVFIFPGSLLQISDNADGLLLLSLISGRNPELLIGNHVVAAPYLKQSKLEIISVGYILIKTGQTTTVEYISQTTPIPNNKPEIAVATAIAGQLLGLKMLYLEAGSGAEHPVSTEIIQQVKANTNIPLIVGGGLRTDKDILKACGAGADIIVTGNITEEKPEKLASITKIIHQFNVSE